MTSYGSEPQEKPDTHSARPFNGGPPSGSENKVLFTSYLKMSFVSSSCTAGAEGADGLDGNGDGLDGGNGEVSCGGEGEGGLDGGNGVTTVGVEGEGGGSKDRTVVVVEGLKKKNR